jgi:hypothetical protein
MCSAHTASRTASRRETPVSEHNNSDAQRWDLLISPLPIERKSAEYTSDQAYPHNVFLEESIDVWFLKSVSPVITTTGESRRLTANVQDGYMADHIVDNFSAFACKLFYGKISHDVGFIDGS